MKLLDTAGINRLGKHGAGSFLGTDLLGADLKQGDRPLVITLAFHAYRVYYRKNSVRSFHYV
ncbi:MAG: hypothetical protein LBQ77_07540 [Treponema sp.]|nr:hypothetical protein [Treponema sp.]